MVFRIAILQMRSENRMYEKNTKTVTEKIQEAACANADLLLLPECFITGYDLTINNKTALTEDCSYINELCQAARKFHIGVVATALTKGNIAPQNSAFIIDKSGKILTKYSKVHTCDFADEKAIESGTEFKVCTFDGVKIGIMICYDREYPESARILMLKGAEIILVPNDCSSMTPRINALSTRAYENMCGIAMANPNGANAGKSCAFSPICWDKDGICVDNILTMADENTCGIYYADFDMDKIRNYREHEMLGNTFRKVRAYGELLNGAVNKPFVRNGQ